MFFSNIGLKVVKVFVNEPRLNKNQQDQTTTIAHAIGTEVISNMQAMYYSLEKLNRKREHINARSYAVVNLRYQTFSQADFNICQTKSVLASLGLTELALFQLLTDRICLPGFDGATLFNQIKS